MDQLLLQPMRRLEIGKYFRPSFDTANRRLMQMTQLREQRAEVATERLAEQRARIRSRRGHIWRGIRLAI